MQQHDPYDLIFLDPPTFSNSKKMKETFDIQRDHIALVRAAAGLLHGEALLRQDGLGFRAKTTLRDYTGFMPRRPADPSPLPLL